jgi:TMEM199 family protein
MARLHREEEARTYQRMVKPHSKLDTFPNNSMAAAFAEVNRPTKESDFGDDDVTYAEVNRQMMLVFNFLVSIAGVAATIWVAARWWNTPARLALTMAGSILVAIAEVAVYSGYIWRLGEAKGKQGKVTEVKEVVQTWVLGSDGSHAESKADDAILVEDKTSKDDTTIRRRNKGLTQS